MSDGYTGLGSRAEIYVLNSTKATSWTFRMRTAAAARSHAMCRWVFDRNHGLCEAEVVKSPRFLACAISHKLVHTDAGLNFQIEPHLVV